MTRLTRTIEILLLTLLAIAALGFLSFLNLYGVFLSLVTVAIAVAVFRRLRWGYFACAAWGLACYQLAKQGYEFAEVKRYIMVLGWIVVIAAIYLHEKLGKKTGNSPPAPRDEG